MQAGTLLLIVADIIGVLKTQGFIAADGSFDENKFNDIPTDLALAAGIEAILKQHGVAVPDKVDKVLQLVPLLAGLFK